jgi:hypothetical protein
VGVTIVESSGIQSILLSSKKRSDVQDQLDHQDESFSTKIAVGDVKTLAGDIELLSFLVRLLLFRNPRTYTAKALPIQ